MVKGSTSLRVEKSKCQGLARQQRRRRKGFKPFRLGGGDQPVVETGKYEIFRKPFMDHHGRCEMDCVEASKETAHGTGRKANGALGAAS